MDNINVNILKIVLVYFTQVQPKATHCSFETTVRQLASDDKRIQLQMLD